MQNENLIKKIVGIFHRNSNLKYDELLQEARLSYLKAMQSYDPEKGRLSSYIWYHVYRDLQNFYNKEKNYAKVIKLIKDYSEVDIIENSEFFFESLTKEANEIAKFVLSVPENFVKSKTVAKRKILQFMRKKHWNEKKVNYTMENLKVSFS